MAVIGFNQTTYTFEEGDGTVEVCAVFLDPGQTAPNVVVELMGSISPSTYYTCYVKVYTLKSRKRAPMHGQSTFYSSQSKRVMGTLKFCFAFNQERVPM